MCERWCDGYRPQPDTTAPSDTQSDAAAQHPSRQNQPRAYGLAMQWSAMHLGGRRALWMDRILKEREWLSDTRNRLCRMMCAKQSRRQENMCMCTQMCKGYRDGSPGLKCLLL